MPNQSVEVSFDPNVEPQFTFFPERVTMTKQGTVVFHKRPNDAPWTFKDGKVEGNNGQFEISVPGDGKVIHMRDKFTDGGKTEHKYTVTVTWEWNNGFQDFESPDPVIVNDPGSKDVDAV